MAKKKRDNNFWTSYSDLMTSLFFVMLVLFVLTITLLHKKIVATQEQLNKIEEIQNSIKNINREHFEYDPQYKRHTLKNVTVSFNQNSFDINDIPSSEQSKLIEVGRSIKDFVQLAVYKNPEVKYLMIIEGQSSKDDYNNNEYYNNDVLSYQRALSLLKYWTKKGVDIDPDYCEIIVSGSGQNSPFRVQPDNRYNRANQRFVIHIIPKPGNIE